MLFGLALILMMIFRPQGLLPSRQRAAELTEATSGAAALGATAIVIEEEEEAAEAEEKLEELLPTLTMAGDGGAGGDVELPEDAVTRAAEVADHVLTLDSVDDEVRRRRRAPTTCRSTSGAARSSASSARTARARRRCSTA